MGSEVVRKFSQLIPREMESLLCLISMRISAIAFGSSSVLPLVWQRFFLGDLDRPKVLPDSRGFPKFSKRLTRDCEQRPRKYASLLMYASSRDGEDDDGMFPFSPTGFLL